MRQVSAVECFSSSRQGHSRILPVWPRTKKYGGLLWKRRSGEDTARKSQTLIAKETQRAWAYDEMACYAKARARKGKASKKTGGSIV